MIKPLTVNFELFYHTFLYNYLYISPLNAELNPIRHLLALVGAHHIVHVSRLRVNFILVVEPSV